jgi:hypothetical protein
VVRHIQTVATLLIVQGCLELVPGLTLTSVAVLVAFGIMKRGVPEASGFPVELGFVIFIYGPVLLALGVFRIWAGLSNRKLLRREWGIAALAAGLLAIPSCYCAPTSLALLIYGLITYLDSQVADAFRDQG